MNFVWPVTVPPKALGAGISFGATRLTTAQPHAHKGIDILGPIGTPVFASAPGNVIVSKAITTLGSPAIVFIDHEGGWQTRYMHLDDKVLPKLGPINVNQPIGSIGYLSKDPHVHFEIRKNTPPGATATDAGTPVDPWPLLTGATGGGLSVLIGMGLAWLVLRKV